MVAFPLKICMKYKHVIYVDTFSPFFWVAWRSEGCTPKEISDTEVNCSCNHLTNFGLLAVSVTINLSVLMYNKCYYFNTSNTYNNVLYFY